MKLLGLNSFGVLELGKSPSMMKNGLSEGVIEIQCRCLDCTLNDRTRFEQGFGLCQEDSVIINATGTCRSYHADFMFIAYNQKYKSDYNNTRNIIETLFHPILL